MKLMTEKVIIPTIIIVSLFIILLYAYSCSKCIEREGGIRTVIVNIGKEIKSIAEDINTEE